MSHPQLGPETLALDCTAEVDRIAAGLREIVTEQRRRGAVVAVSGGVDSGVCLALAVRALGPSRVFALMLPERDSSPDSARRALQAITPLGVEHETEDIAPALQALGCYRRRDEAIRSVVPSYADNWKSKIAIAGGRNGAFNYFKLVTRSPEGIVDETRLPLKAYLQIVAATGFKQRIRKTIEYFHADRLNYAVIGTPNRLEYDQGFFVKNGDGAADIKPIAHLYKTQVYALARHLGLPREICEATPTTDTYSLAQGQDEFYFALPYQQMDIALWAHNHAIPVEALAAFLDVPAALAEHVYRDIEAKRRATRALHAAPRLIEPVTEILP